MLLQKKSIRSMLFSLLMLPLSVIADELLPYPGAVFQPDLVLENFEHRINSRSGQLETSLNAINRGSVATGRTPVFIEFRTGPDLESARVLDGIKELILQPGEIRAVTISFDLADIDQHLFAVIDPDNFIEESNEKNNVAMSSVPATQVVIEPGADSDSVPELDTSLTIDGGDEFNVGETPRLLVTVSTESYAGSELGAILTVKNANGETIFTSGNLPLLFDDLSGDWRAEFFWQTLGLPEGIYALIVSIVNEENGEIDRAQREVTLVSANANRAPVAMPDKAETYLGAPVEIDMMVNDHDPDGNRLEHNISELPMHGKISELRGIALYEPAPGFVGIDRFAYQLDDTLGGSAWADVTVKVLPDKDGCTWVRDFSTNSSAGKVAEDGWADFNLPEQGNGDYASWIKSNDNPDLFEQQPFISFPSCSLYFKPKTGMSGSATVTYVVLDKATSGNEYVSEPRHFTIDITTDGEAPHIVSKPVTLIESGNTYRYTPQLSIDSASTLTAIVLPDFLSVEGYSVVGTPQESDIGMHEIWLVIEADGRATRQSYLLTVQPQLAAANGAIPADDQGDLIEIDGGAGAGSPWLMLLAVPVLLRARRRSR